MHNGSRHPRDPRDHHDDACRGRKRSASRSRSNSRDRKRSDRDHEDRGRSSGHSSDYDRDKPRDREYRNHYGNQHDGASSRLGEPNTTVVIKGLPPQTNDATLYAVVGPYYPKEVRVIAQRDGECKGFAFVEFVSVEYAEYFVKAFAGSTGDLRAPQLIVDNRAVTLEYARDSKTPYTRGPVGPRAMKSDWLCEACGCHNFARRDACFRCNLPRSERSVAVASTGTSGGGDLAHAAAEAFADSVVCVDTPCAVLVLKGFLPQVTEAHVEELFRQFSAVSSVQFVRDLQTQVPVLAYIVFPTPDGAAHALHAVHEHVLPHQPHLRLAFARETTMQRLLLSMHQLASSAVPTHHPLPKAAASGLVATAMQAAQWALNNGYSSAQQVSVAPVPAAASAPATTALPTTTVTPETTVAPTVTAPPPIIFPPLFETNGTAYIFQPRTGYFLEPRSDFFYCPKAKVYYHAKDGQYYRYNTATQGFERVLPPLPKEPYHEASAALTATTSAAQDTKTEEAKSSAEPNPTPLKLSMKLSKKASAAGGGTGTVALGQKAAHQNIAKWGAIQKEFRDEEEATPSEPAPVAAITAPTKASNGSPGPVTTASKELVPASVLEAAAILAAAPTPVPPTPTPTPAAVSQAAPTATGSFVCLLCRRQFTSAEMLQRHEKESKLHAENLAKQQQQQQQKAQPQYRDRAEERRELFGSVADHVRKTDVPVVLSSAPTVTAVTAHLIAPVVSAPAVPLSEDVNNPGNLLMRKFGWQEGQGLGKDGDGRVTAVGVELADSEAQRTHMHATLRSTQGKDTAHGNRDAQMAITRARFEQS